ncbi:heterodimeric geranylgeranyl pyrophosphate synthase large subunit 2-like [Cryptomeria japonica]|uniref:heterodimeric geranylgeranyl pyrophosphate synthase large subunit 2-like n=1 Tax=Cryptomeria japonica TaxID=3369 RepID=UPI0025AC90AC|nr:heterodimeric geranylgeranyl pyrophosphate synthase large subunit 2-like [Cryptomeria japonica]
MAVDGMLPVGYPEKIHEAMRYSLLSAPPKMRCPLLCTAACHVINGTRKQSLPAATAVAMLHASMLAHDELPCMDSWGCFVWLGISALNESKRFRWLLGVMLEVGRMVMSRGLGAMGGLWGLCTKIVGDMLHMNGASQGSDRVTYLKVHGMERCRSIVDELIVKAKDFLSFFAHTLAAPLLSFADYAATRSY